MENYYPKLVETLIVVLFYLIVRGVSFKIINKTLHERLIQESRGFVIKRVIHIVFLVITFIFILLVWGVDQADLAVFVGSVLTIVGVAFFAQWSLLSNITSSVILFFNHPVRLYDSIMILEGKEYVIEGKVINIGLFFITIETKQGEELTLPNNIFIQKSIIKQPEAAQIEEADDTVTHT